MQILQWLFKRAHEQEERNSSNFKREYISEQNGGKEISLLKNDGSNKRTKKLEWRKQNCKSLKIFTFLYRKDIPKACFYSTLNIKRLSLNRRQFFYFMKMKKEESFREERTVSKTDSIGHAGNKVLPITEAPLSSLAERNDQCDQIKGHKKKPISRMKELLRWAPSAKTEKGGKFNGKKILMFRRRGNLKAVPDDDQFSSESPKISFRWDVESCSTTSSAYSAISMASSSKIGQNKITTSTISIPSTENGHITRRKGNWITTDSDFVVLEL